MVERPERRVEEFAAAGADSIIVHWEATPHVHYALKAVREAGLHAGLALNPATPTGRGHRARGVARPRALHDREPGLGRAAVHRGLHGRVARLRELLGPDMPIEVDGGIAAAEARPCAEAGATLFVAGSSIFRTPGPRRRLPRDRRRGGRV